MTELIDKINNYFCHMTIQVLLFGITTDLLETSSVNLELADNSSVSSFKMVLVKTYPKLATLQSYAVAINEAYAKDSQTIKPNDVVAIIPPVSGG